VAEKLSEDLVLKIANEVADTMIGTCQMLDPEVEKVGKEYGVIDAHRNYQISQAISELMFCCEGCEWYCSIDELHDDTLILCDECNDGLDE
jgi:hypothetical protein